MSKRRATRRGPANRKFRARRASRRRVARQVVARQRRPRRHRRVIAIAFAVALAAGAAAAAVVYWRFVERRSPGGDHVPVSWPDGLDASEAALLLSDLGLTDSPAAMEVFLRATDAPPCFVPGPHLLPRGATPRELVACLCRRPDRARVKVTIPEGFHRFAVAERLEKKGVASRAAFLHASADRELLYPLGVEPGALPEADSAEGYLFPATYELAVDADPTEIVRRMVGEANRRWTRLTERHADRWAALQEELEIGRREVLTLASMVEKEAAVDEERALIASVFLNRLRDPEYPRLQSDPTAVYGCHVMPDRIAACAEFDGRATGAINRDQANVYSTYVVVGLPPGPIANPGEASIEAVLAPADTPFRFFVAKGKGRHEFSVDYDDHNKAVERLRAQRAR